MKNEEKKEIKQIPVESNTIIQFLHTKKKITYILKNRTLTSWRKFFAVLSR